MRKERIDRSTVDFLDDTIWYDTRGMMWLGQQAGMIILKGNDYPIYLYGKIDM